MSSLQTPPSDQSATPLLGCQVDIAAIDGLRDVGAFFHQRGWSVGTSSNYSVLLQQDPLQLLLTASGKDKGKLSRSDFVVVDAEGKGMDPRFPKPSAETLLHVAIAEELSEVGAILHTHSIWGTLLSDLYFKEGGFSIEGYEMLKGLEGIKTHEHREWVEIFDNTQDIPQLAQQLRTRLRHPENPIQHGFLIRNHGLYTWGKDLFAARRHIEIFEFLFEVLYRKRQLQGT
ncbi:Methylthioribulose-1-phosphate dehydratase [Planctomycetales bacterium 10988]|nr:Methylthioribulose-1-phosphate dehydratase [Planctomycetales bacterium 10988]